MDILEILKHELKLEREKQKNIELLKNNNAKEITEKKKMIKYRQKKDAQKRSLHINLDKNKNLTLIAKQLYNAKIATNTCNYSLEYINRI